MNIRIGFYVCHCGINIAGMVRVEEVAAYARTIKNVVISRDYKFMCSDPGQELIEKDIRDYQLNRVVVASCSPRLHEKTFQSVLARTGLNPYQFQMASVREQVSWVTDDRDRATRKAKTLAAAALARVNFHQSLAQRKVSIHPDIMVVGGGIAGMQAAIDIGNSGLTAWLVEKDTTIGGHMLQFDKTFPTLDCAACIGTPKMVETAQNEHINLLSNSVVEEVSGYIGNYTVTVRKKARYVNSKCTGCGECATVCPVELPSEWDVGLQKRTAIYRAFPQAVPITFAIDKKSTPPCRTACPAGTNVQGYVQMVKQGKYQEALDIIMERLPLPGVLGRVCPHPCETACRRALIDDAISIRNLKRVAADHGDVNKRPLPKLPEKDAPIAIVGSGPAGLTVAYYLRLKGYPVTLFEAMDQPGGMLRTGIPDYRLPPEILNQEIDHILSTGILLKTGQALGRDFTLNSLKEEGFKAIFLGIGAQLPMAMNIENETVHGVVDAVAFLQRINLKQEMPVSGHVVVIGGGNVAMDAARVAIRSGADAVTVVYRRSKAEMPAEAEEIIGAEEEGIWFVHLTTPVGISEEAGRVTGIKCIKNKLGPDDGSGRRRPVPIADSEFTIACDMVIPAIGQRVDTLWQNRETPMELTARGTLVVDPETMETTIPGVYAAGDGVSGPATVVEAVAAGHRVVCAIDSRLSASDNEKEEVIKEKIHQKMVKDFPGIFEPELDPTWSDLPINPVITPRREPVLMHSTSRTANFEEVDLGLDEVSARIEAQRCINCGGCCECMQCVTACKPEAVNHNDQDELIDIQVGSIITATGFDALDPTPMKPYGYGKFPNVFTNLEFERLSNATGPTGGQILIRDNQGQLTRTPKSVAILHCIGSRDINYHTYCSRVCCMYALKYGHLIHEKAGHDAIVYNYYIDMRCFGKGYEEFYIKCQEEGTRFIRGKVASISQAPRTDVHYDTDERVNNAETDQKLLVISEDTLLGEVIKTEVDMVILCTAMEARKDARDIGRILGINQGADGFFLEEHPKLGPLNTATDGVFIAGACQGPKDIPDTVAQASGAAAKSLLLAARGEVEIPSTVSHIDEDICAGCKTCIGLCPYTAISFDENKNVSVVNEALCKGCGSCSGFCPSGAAQVRHFNEKQLFSELNGVMDAIHAIGI
ncbi:FAD-dependent oxidoreductase [Desulfocicer niacini]